MFQHMGNELRVNPHLLKAVDINTSFDASKGGALGGSIEMTTKDAQDFASKIRKRSNPKKWISDKYPIKNRKFDGI